MESLLNFSSSATLHPLRPHTPDQNLPLYPEQAGYAEYGYCAWHSRYFWELRLHLISNLHGLPVGYAVTGTKADAPAALLSMLDTVRVAVPDGQVLMADKGYNGAWLEEELTCGGMELIRPARKGRKAQAREEVPETVAATNRVGV